MEEIRSVAATSDPVVRAQRSHQLLGGYQDAVTELLRIRREALQELSAAGMSHGQMADELELSRSRIGQILKTGPLSERAFLGDGALTVVIGEKKEEGHDKPVIAVETMTAFNRLKDLAHGYQLDAKHETSSPPGIFDLNRHNLVVMAGPRLFPLVGQILDGDPNLRFATEGGAWVLRDLKAKKTFRAPRDEDGTPRDFGYLGRLPRPDGNGTFLCMAGLHATGTQGVVAYLETALPEVYSEAKTGRFSMAITCEYDPTTGNVAAATAASPIYTRS